MRRIHAVFVVVGLLLGGLVATLLALRGGAAWDEGLILGLPLGLVFAAICLAARYPCRAAPLTRMAAVGVGGTHAAAAILSAGLWVFLGVGLARLLDTAPRFTGVAERFTAEAPTLLMVGVLVYLLAVAVHYLIIALDAARDAEVLGVRATVLAREAELRALRAQVDPHFLFNSLNSIGALTTDDPQAARRMCLLLAGFLRRSIAIGARERVTLDEELSLVGDYLAVEQVRFGARLEVRLAIDPDCRACSVPPLLLQPLVENAVRHGIAHLLEGGVLAITARRARGVIEVRIENPRDPDRPTSRGEGVGLANVRGRLQSLFGETAGFEVEARGATFRVTLTLPAATAAAEGPAAAGASAGSTATGSAAVGSAPGEAEVKNAASA
jgi:hypothetical protein